MAAADFDRGAGNRQIWLTRSAVTVGNSPPHFETERKISSDVRQRPRLESDPTAAILRAAPSGQLRQVTRAALDFVLHRGPIDRSRNCLAFLQRRDAHGFGRRQHSGMGSPLDGSPDHAYAVGKVAISFDQSSVLGREVFAHRGRTLIIVHPARPSPRASRRRGRHNTSSVLTYLPAKSTLILGLSSWRCGPSARSTPSGDMRRRSTWCEMRVTILRNDCRTVEARNNSCRQQRPEFTGRGFW